MAITTRTKSKVSAWDEGAHELRLSIGDDAIEVCVGNVWSDKESKDIRLSWEDAATLKRWLGRRLRERSE